LQTLEQDAASGASVWERVDCTDTGSSVIAIRRRDVSESVSQRREILFSGNVQGVGFRYTTQRIAAGYAVTGFVRNLRNGGVQVVAEGPAEELDGFVSTLQTRMQRFIRCVTVDNLAATGEFSHFEIRF
jgi:acylphosphatase